MIISFSGCCFKRCEPDCSDLNELEKLNSSGGVFGKARVVGVVRAQALRETALGVGARGGLAFRACQINRMLTKNEAILYRTFNFNLIMLDKSVLPPVLIEGRNTLTLGGPDVIRIADRNFHILFQAKFVTAPPTWRDYLWLCYENPELPDRSLLPRHQDERIIWKRFIDEGWEAGIQQANLIFKESVGRLKRDYEGMLRYRSLLAQNMVSPPFVAEMDMGVTGCPNDLNIHDRILRITALPALQCDSRNWKAEITPVDCDICDQILEALPITCNESDNARYQAERREASIQKTQRTKYYK